MKVKMLFSFILSLFFCTALGARKSAKFLPVTVAEISGIYQYKKMGTSSYFGLSGQNSKAKCAIVCLHEDECRSFYTDSGACVFGVTSDVTAFKNGEEVTPDEDQKIQVKGKIYFLKFIWFTIVVHKILSTDYLKHGHLLFWTNSIIFN